MMPTRVTDLLPDSIAQWFVRRRSNANGSVPADAALSPERDEERAAAPPAKRPRFEENAYYAQNDQPPPPPQPEPVAGPSGYKSEPLPAPPPQREAAVDSRRSANLSLLNCNRSVTRHSLGERDSARKKKESPLKPTESPVKQNVTVSGSPFYRGRTMYGGAAASGMYMYEPNIRERRTAVPSQPLCNVDNSISYTSRRLMGILERCSTPSFERKTPQVKTQPNMSDSLNTTLTGRSLASFNSSKTQELHISHLPTLLKLKQGARLRESTRAARHIANSNSPVFTPYTPVATAPSQPIIQEITSTPVRELSNQTNKIKSQIGRSARKAAQNTIESEIAPPLNLPEVTLKIDQANLPKFSFPAATVTKKCETTETKTTSYKFSMPTSITENHINIPSDTNNYKFSKPAEVTEKLTNGPFVFGVTKATTEIKKTETIVTEKKSSGWKCEDCWIVNKDADSKCLACTAPRPAGKPEVSKTDAFKKIDDKGWQCKDCSAFNKGADEKCSCGGTSTGKTEKLTPLVVKPTKEWRCNDCWVQNKEDVNKCVACGGSKPGTVPEGSKPEIVEKVVDWKCSDCWVMNKDSADKCIACGGSKPSKHKEQKQDSKNAAQSNSGFEGFIQSKKKQWSCSDCWVNNEESAEKCVACGGANPTKKTEAKKDDTFSELVKKQTELWECPTCLTRNDNLVSKCVCCEAAKPGSNKHEDVKFNFSATPAFKFGIQASQEPPKAVEKPKEIESNNNNTSKTVTFTFGVPKPEEKDEGKEKPKFSFGTPAASQETTPAFKFNVPAIPKAEETQDKSKTEVDGVKSTDKGAGFKLPTMNASAGLFTFNAQKPTEPEKSETSKPSPIVPVLATPTTKTAEAKPPSVLFGIPSTTAKSPAAPLFGITSPKTDTAVSANSTLFGVPPTAKETNASSTPFGVPSASKSEATSLFGVTSPKTDANASGIFGITPSKPAESLAVAKSDATTFTAAKTEAQPTLFTFGATTQGNAKPPPNRFNFSFGAASSESAPQFNSSFGSNQKPPPAYGASNTSLGAFGATNTQASALPSFGSLTTQANATVPTFGSLTTQAGSAASFGSLTTQAGSTAPFGSLTTQASSATPFGSLTTQASSATPFGSLTTQAGSAAPFGSLTTQAGSTPAFGSLTTQTSTALPAFGSLTTQAKTSAPTFGSTQNNVSAPTFGSTQPNVTAPTFGSTQANVAAPTFGSLTTQANPPAFGSTTQANPAGTFGSPSANMFGSQPQGGLFGATAQSENKFASPAAKPAFSFGASSNSLFGSQNQTPSVFGSNQTQNMFNAQPANPAPMGMFGSPAPAFGSAPSLQGLGQPQAQLGQPQAQLGQPQAQLGQPQAQLGQQNMLGQSQAFSFGSPNAAPVFAFGQQTAPQQSTGMFSFGATAAPNVQFNLGSSTGSPQTALQPGRKLRKAVRRTQR